MTDRWPLTTLLIPPDRCVQGSGGLTLDSLPGIRPGERKLGRESGVGGPGFDLLCELRGPGQHPSRCAYLSFLTCMSTCLTQLL